ncbi:hypothetical protein LMG28688_01680 [Paraburkholderia caffeinitolerans]|uniref:Uncharacterized protein n=1 Tax=Paraburkholderia caffeinitolerans TaxID=1723730 RepID=A0A6J5FNI4_9BURK|nr:hypothetical protein [Paraburkholderia caffeinitolerans]CAB3783601.1 hypothetical protein LMG28688_01680 [Paraburkholderia caffeinitolerans]
MKFRSLVQFAPFAAGLVCAGVTQGAWATSVAVGISIPLAPPPVVAVPAPTYGVAMVAAPIVAAPAAVVAAPVVVGPPIVAAPVYVARPPAVVVRGGYGYVGRGVVVVR